MGINHLIFLVQGLFGTVVLSLLTFLFGGCLAFIIALGRISPKAMINGACRFYIAMVQGIPLLVLMGLCFFGPNLLGYKSVSPLAAATLSMAIYSSAFLGEIWRGCFETVQKAQWEAAECLGLTRWQRMSRIILPQALRIAVPPTVGFMVQIIKNTSVASLIIGYADLSYHAKILNNATFEPFTIFGLAAVMYFAVCYPLSQQSRKFERKLNVGHR